MCDLLYAWQGNASRGWCAQTMKCLAPKSSLWFAMGGARVFY